MTTLLTGIPQFSVEFLVEQKAKLLDLQEQLFSHLGILQSDAHDQDIGNGCGLHIADRSSATTEKEFTLTLLCMEKDVCAEIADALTRIRNGTYGICELTGEVIPPERLEVRPYARYTVKAQERVDREPHLIYRKRLAVLFTDEKNEEDEEANG